MTEQAPTLKRAVDELIAGTRTGIDQRKHMVESSRRGLSAPPLVPAKQSLVLQFRKIVTCLDQGFCYRVAGVAVEYDTASPARR